MSVATQSAAGLAARAAALVPMLRASAADTENARRVPSASLDALSAAGVFRMMAPKRYVGEAALKIDSADAAVRQGALWARAEHDSVLSATRS